LLALSSSSTHLKILQHARQISISSHGEKEEEEEEEEEKDMI